MYTDLMTALKEIKRKANGEEVSKVRLINGDILKGIIEDVKANTLILKGENKGAGRPILTIPLSSVLYVSDCELNAQ